MDKGKYTEAMSLFKQLLEIYEATIGLEHPDALEVMKNIENPNLPGGVITEWILQLITKHKRDTTDAKKGSASKQG